MDPLDPERDDAVRLARLGFTSALAGLLDVDPGSDTGSPAP